MAQITVTPFVLSDVLLKVASSNYEKAVSQVEFQPAGGITNWKGLTPEAVFSFPQGVTWSCVLAYAQDWATDDSLSQYLFEHQGETVSVEFSPVKGGPTVYADVIIVPGSIGGTVDAVGVGTVTLGVLGKPSFTAPSAG
ncbi:hypothetical protein EDF52_10284 [Curtobacterium sp. PhB42]|uniref:hypothetical protein n=1 Tax=unclassified Curtobacterium TaxID=257496 RepID=UPI001062E308|nr:MULTISPECIES: hypothetical protein [unclassified Curtobacterium]TDW50996.1 hypothetical protein EDF52_10284 [Curtobacterium sp. PhB42]TDW56158.1 hypothetical protein EDF47_104269 [Curtobacterium sp. PhB190]